MQTYPVFLNINRQRVLVVGAGAVGRRKIAGLLAHGPAEILVLDICEARRKELPDASCIHFACRSFSPEDTVGMSLVFAASSDRKTNSKIAIHCKEQGIPCNVADAPEEGTFHVPSLFSTGEFTIAFSTGGSSPALARRIGREVKDQYGPLLELMNRLRPLVLALGFSSDENATIFRTLVDSDLAEILRNGNVSSMQGDAEKLLRHLLPAALHQDIRSLLPDV